MEDALKPFASLIVSHAEWLVDRLQEYAGAYGFGTLLPERREAWQEFVSTCSHGLLSSLEEHPQPFALTAVPDGQHPVRRLSVRLRQLLVGHHDLLAHLGLVKYLQQTYQDLLDQSGQTRIAREYGRLYLSRFFDLLELCIISGATAGTNNVERNSAAGNGNVAVNLLLEQLFQYAGQGLLLLAPSGRIQRVNLVASQLLGFDPAQLVGQFFHQTARFQLPDHTPVSPEECHFCQACRRGEWLYSDEEIVVKADGERIPVEMTNSPIRIDGVLLGNILTIADVALRKILEDQGVSYGPLA